MTKKELLAELHPGRTLSEDVLIPLGMSVNALAKTLRVPVTRMNDIVLGRRGVSADTALRLSRYLGTSAPILAQSSVHLRTASCRVRQGEDDQEAGASERCRLSFGFGQPARSNFVLNWFEELKEGVPVP